MPIYLEKLQTKLNAILAKDLDDITAKRVYLPFIGNTYSKAELQAWLQKRIDFLEYARTRTDVQVISARTGIYNTLNANDKQIANRIIAGQDWGGLTISGGDGYEKLCGIILYTFLMNP